MQYSSSGYNQYQGNISGTSLFCLKDFKTHHKQLGVKKKKVNKGKEVGCCFQHIVHKKVSCALYKNKHIFLYMTHRAYAPKIFQFRQN